MLLTKYDVIIYGVWDENVLNNDLEIGCNKSDLKRPKKSKMQNIIVSLAVFIASWPSF